MPKSEQNPHVLKQPNIGPQQDVSPEAAYLAAVTCMPRLMSDIGKVLTGILDELNGIHDKLDVIALYHERKGLDDKLFSSEDLTPEDEEDEPESI